MRGNNRISAGIERITGYLLEEPPFGGSFAVLARLESDCIPCEAADVFIKSSDKAFTMEGSKAVMLYSLTQRQIKAIMNERCLSENGGIL